MSALPAEPVIDFDNHYYEPDDCFTRHIERRFAERTVRIVRPGGSFGQVHIAGRRSTYTSVTPGDFTGAPGALQGVFEGKIDDGLAMGEAIRAADYPAFTDRAARLALMDDQGIAAAVLLPTLGLSTEHEMRSDPELVDASLRAFNRWLEDDWGYSHEGRIFAVPTLSLIEIDRAVVELDRVLACGARLVHLTPGPQDGRSPADPVFDPFWARVDEAGVPVVFHIGNSGYLDLIGTQWSENPSNPYHELSPLQWALCMTERPIVDTLSALVLHNLFGRFPNVRVVSVENGAAWVAHLLKTLDKAVLLGRRGPMLGGALADKPSDVFKAHVSVCPFPEDDIPGLVDLLGSEQVLFGSDYPHPEGMAEPKRFADFLSGFPEADVRNVMWENGASLVGLTKRRRECR